MSKKFIKNLIKRTTFISKDGEAVYDPMTIAKNYLKGWFAIDAISAMPYDLLVEL